MPESYIFNNIAADSASVSYHEGGILYSGDITATLSVGTYVYLDAGDGTLANLEMDYPYYIVSASDEGFAVAYSSIESAIEITASSTGGELFSVAPVGRVFDASQGRSFVYSLSANSTASGSVYFVGSIQNTEPNFLASQSTSNRWDYLDVYDLQTASSIDGNTGVDIAAPDVDVNMYQVFGNNLKWISAIIRNLEAGGIYIGGQINN